MLIIASDHGHETVSGVIDVEADLIEAGLNMARTRPTSWPWRTARDADLSAPDAASRRAALDAHLRAASWAGAVFAEDQLGEVGQAAHQGSPSRPDEVDGGLNEHGVPDVPWWRNRAGTSRTASDAANTAVWAFSSNPPCS